MFEPSGFPRPLPARERKWKTPNGKANFTVPKSTVNRPSEADGVYELMTMRADGQFNTTVYNEDDRFRGVYGSRDVVLMNADDMKEIGLAQGDFVTLSTEFEDGIQRRLTDLQVVTYDIPRKNIAGYYPECNGLIPLSHFAEGSKVPASKSVPVRIVPQERDRVAEHRSATAINDYDASDVTPKRKDQRGQDNPRAANSAGSVEKANKGSPTASRMNLLLAERASSPPSSTAHELLGASSLDTILLFIGRFRLPRLSNSPRKVRHG